MHGETTKLGPLCLIQEHNKYTITYSHSSKTRFSHYSEWIRIELRGFDY